MPTEADFPSDLRALEGEYEYPEDKATLTADFGTEDYGVYASINYIGPFEDTPDLDLDGCRPVGRAPAAAARSSSCT